MAKSTATVGTDETTETDTESVEEVETPETDTEESTEDTEESTEESIEESIDDESDEDESDDEGLDLESAKAALAKVRRSEAKYRTRLREAEQKLADAKTPDEVAAAIEEIKQSNAADARNLIVENVALKHGLPEELAEALKGETREELEAHAKKLAKFVPSTPAEDPDLSGGLEPDDGDEGSYTEEQARKKLRERKASRFH